jgi:hypothetical protein
VQYKFKISLSFIASLLKPSQNRRIPSTNKIWDRKTPPPILMPLKALDLFASTIAFFSPSTTIRNSNGERGHPYPSPLLGLNNFEVDPFIKMAKETQDTAHNPVNKVEINP